MPDVIEPDMAPSSFRVISAPRFNGHLGESLTVVYGENLNVTAVLDPIFPTSFELQTDSTASDSR